MKKVTEKKILEIILFAFPCCWPILLMVIALAIWKVGINEPDLIPLAGLSFAIIVASIFLLKRSYWISLPMILLGIYICFGLKEEQHFGIIFQTYGAYFILHYLACGLYTYKDRTKG